MGFVTLAVENEDVWLKKKGASGHYLKPNSFLCIASYSSSAVHDLMEISVF